MSALNLCFFGLLLLAISAQVRAFDKNDVQLEKKIDETSLRIATSIHNFLNRRRTNILEKLSDKIASLKNTPGKCAFKNLKQIETLRRDISLDTCPALKNLTDDIEGLLKNGSGLVLEVLQDVIAIISNFAKCFAANPTDVHCYTQAVGDTVNDVVQIAQHSVHLVAHVAQTVLNTLQGVVQCIKAQSLTEKQFNKIASAECNES